MDVLGRRVGWSICKHRLTIFPSIYTMNKLTKLKGRALIIAAYESPALGLQSAPKLTKKLKTIDNSITLKQVRAVVDGHEADQITKQKKRPGFHHIVSPDVGVGLQADILDLQKYSGVNKGYRYILSIIDIYSRYGWMLPLKNKSAPTIAKTFTDLFEGKLEPKMKRKYKPPVNISTDNGSEFIANQVQAVFKKYGVKSWLADVGDHNRVGLVERFNRSIRGYLRKYWALKNTKQWVDVIDQIAINYNTSNHRTIDARPIDVYSGKTIPAFQKKVAVATFKAGDHVRKKIIQKTFEKQTERWSRDVYKVVRAEGRGYVLMNLSTGTELKNKSKPEQLLKVSKSVIRSENKINDSSIAAQQIWDAKTDLLNKQAGVDKANIIRTKRPPKPTAKAAAISKPKKKAVVANTRPKRKTRKPAKLRD